MEKTDLENVWIQTVELSKYIARNCMENMDFVNLTEDFILSEKTYKNMSAEMNGKYWLWICLILSPSC